jgi:Calcineurin-like phosphoesterase
MKIRQRSLEKRGSWVGLVFGLLFVSLSLSFMAHAQSQSFVFTAGGDHGGPGQSDTRSSLQAIVNSGAAFHVALGDMTYSEAGSEPTNGVTPSPWCSGSNPNKNIKLTIGNTFPFQLIVGNHEDDNFVDGFINNFAVCLPDRMNSTGVYGAEYYFDYPQPNPYLRMILIGAGNDVAGERYDYLAGNAHYQWLVNAIDAARQSNIPWVVVGMHKLCLTIGNKSCEIGEALMDVLIAKRVDLVLHGHDHDYQRSKQLTCANANAFNAACVIDDGADGAYVKGAGTIFVVNAAFGGGGFTPINCSDLERGYFARAMGGNGSVLAGGSCSTQRVGRGISVYTVTPDRLEGRFVMSVETGGSGALFSDTFSIVQEGVPAVTLIAPADQSSTTQPRPAFTWNPISGLMAYEIQLGQTDPPADTFTATRALYTPPGDLIPGVYYWRVRGVHAGSETPPWSEMWSVTILSAQGAAPWRAVFISATRQATLTWNPVTWATQYDLQISASSNMNPLVYNETLSGLAQTVTLPSYGVYYWRVRGRTGTTVGAWSAVESFRLSEV